MAVARLSEIRSKPAFRKGLIAALSALFIYTVFGFFALPAILKARLPAVLSEALHRKVSVREIRVNPFVLSATVRGLEISDRRSTATWISVGEIYANAQLASVIRGGPVLRELRIARPYVRITRREDGSYNFTDLIEESNKKPVKPHEPLKYSMNNIQIVDGSVDFVDEPRATRHEIRDLRLAIPFISNLKYYVNWKVRPAFSAMINGDNVSLQGRTEPFSKSLETVFDIDFRGLDVPHYLAYLPFRREFDVPSAFLDVKATVTFSEHPEGPPTVRVQGNVALRKVRITGTDNTPMIWLPSVEAVIAPADIGAREFRLAALTVTDPEIDVVIDRTKRLNLLSLIPENTTGKAPSENNDAPNGPSPALKEPVFAVDAVRVEGAKVRFEDRSLPKPFRTAVKDLRVTIDRFSTEKGNTADASLSLTTDATERVALKGRFSVRPPGSEGTISLNKIVLGRYAPYYMDAVRFDVLGGTLDAQTAYRFAQGPNQPTVLLSGLEATVAELRLRQREEADDFVKIPNLFVGNAQVDLEKREVVIGDLGTKNGVVSVRRGPGGQVNVAQLVAEQRAQAASAKDRPRAASEPERPATPWVVTLKKGAIDGYTVRFHDEATEPPVDVALEKLRLHVKNLGTDKDRKGTFAFSTVYNRTGKLSLAGDATVNPPSLKAKIRADALPIGVAQPYYTRGVKIVLTGGSYSGDGMLTVEAPEGKPIQARYRGDMLLRDFSSVDKARSEEFLKFGTLHLGGVDAGFHPTKVSIREIALSDFYSRIIINPDGTLNVQGIVGTAQTDNTSGRPPTFAPADNATISAPVDVRIDAVTLQGGRVNFSDQFIRPNYSANLVGFGGRVSGLSSDPGVLADVDLRGNLGRGAPVEVKGEINPLAEPLFLDLRATVGDIDLSPLTPYSEKYAGYAIEKGQLTLNLKYRVEKGKLSADNKVFVDQFTFGQAVESPDATNLPVRLAVALLKDRNGEIHLEIPVSGELDDPHFSVVGVVWKVVKNLLVKAATAPFALLGAIFGGGGEQLSYLEFPPGAAAVPDPGMTKIDQLAKALRDRPGIRLEVEGHVDVKSDREALRERMFHRKLAALKAEDLANAGQPVPALDNVRIEPQEYERYLARAYRQEKFPKPRTFLGTEKALPVAEMEKLILANIRVTDDDLRSLAEERARSVRDLLVAKESVSPGRVFLVTPKSLAPEKKENLKDSRVDFRIT
jgi:hypothetical protein